MTFNLASGTLANPLTVANLGTGTVTINQTTAYSTLSGTLTLNRPTTITGGGSDRVAISGKITGNVGTLTVIGAPRVTFDQTVGNANDFTGDVVITAGALQLNTIYGLPSFADVTVNSGATFRLAPGANSTVTIDSLNGAGAISGDTGNGNYFKTLSIGNNGGGGTYSGVISDGPANSGPIAITKNGIGTYSLNALGTPGALYYVVASGNIKAPMSAWIPVVGGTNTASSPSGTWSCVVSNPAPVFYRSIAVNPAP